MTIMHDDLIPHLEIGYAHYLRMNAKRAGHTPSREEFLTDICSRIGGCRNRHAWKNTLGAQRVQEYLQKRLTPGRLRLPDNYDLINGKRAP